MKKMNLKFNYFRLLFLVFVLVCILLPIGITSQAFAAISTESNVLDDLRKDEAFDIGLYPANAKDYSIQVIQVAESANGDLLVYAYQPCQNTTPLTATQINMSLTDKMGGFVTDETELTDEDKPKLFSLELLNSKGVFCKYRVIDFTVSEETTRYYNVVSIYRDWIKGKDPETGNDNETNAVYFPVNKLYTMRTENGVEYCFCKDIDYVEILDPYVDFVSYYNGLDWAAILFMTEKYSDIHYIAFSTDKKIDTLKEADVTYRTQSYTQGRGTSYGSLSEPQYKTLTGEKDISTKNGRYTWKSIMTSSDFIKSTELNDTAKKEVEKSEFVLVFLSTSYSQRSAGDSVGHYTKKEGTKVSNVSILRLEFETDGVVYNLGALMNQIEGDDIPGNQEKPLGFWAFIWRCIVRLFNGTATLWEQIVAIFALFFAFLFLPIVLVVLSIAFPAFGAVLKQILKAIGKGLLYFLKGIWWVICLPFKGIAALIRKKRGE